MSMFDWPGRIHVSCVARAMGGLLRRRTVRLSGRALSPA